MMITIRRRRQSLFRLQKLMNEVQFNELGNDLVLA